MKSIALVILAVCQITFYAAPAQSDGTSLRCGNALVSIGDTMYKVRRQCGDPLHDQKIGERRRYRIDLQEHLKIEEIIHVVEWVYERHQGEYILTFEGSRLVKKEYLK